jgi:hypothetical protein
MGEGRDLQCRWIAGATLRAIPKQSLPTTMERPVPKNERPGAPAVGDSYCIDDIAFRTSDCLHCGHTFESHFSKI